VSYSDRDFTAYQCATQWGKLQSTLDSVPCSPSYAMSPSGRGMVGQRGLRHTEPRRA
jgi:hypothetical protein